MRKTYYYTNELTDDFAQTKGVKQQKIIDGNYKYRHDNVLYKIGSFVLYRMFATPIGWLHNKIGYGVRIKNRKAVKKVKDGFFLYGNHTQSVFDAFNASLVPFPRATKLIANPDAVSIPVIGKITPMLGAMPLPSDLSAARNFLAEMKNTVNKGGVVAIYPEAHIWPYYNGVRNFVDASFAYPIKMKVPTVAMVTIYRKRKVFKNLPPRITVYVSDPIFPEEYTDKKALRDAVYNFMTETIAKHGSEGYHTYVKVDSEGATQQPQV